ncbi:MAG: glycosyltransferase family 39 protein [Thermosphaera sp.]
MIFLVPRLIGLGWDTWNVDAQRWMIRSDLFVKNLLDLNFAETYQSYHPGVTVMWLSGFSKWLFYTAFEYAAHYSPKISSGFVYPEQFYLAAFFSKMPLVIAISILLTYSCIILTKIGSPKSLVIIFAILISFEPYFLGVSRFMHLTGLETSLTFASVVSVLYAIAKGEFKYFFITGLLLGLGFATKSSALVVFPFLIFLVFVYNLLENVLQQQYQMQYYFL